MRLLTATIVHECNVFLPLKADLEHFRNDQLIFDQEIIDFYTNAKTFVGGFIDKSKELGFELIPTVYANASAFGVITKEAYDYVLNEILTRAEKAKDIDGVLLFTHGAGYTEEYPDMEGHYFRELRKVVGSEIPMVSTFDWHANHTEEWQKHLDVPVGNDTYPHIDSYERGLEGADIIVKMIKDEIKPTKAFVKAPLILSAQAQYTGRYPLTELFDRIHQLEAREDVVTITAAGGFPWCDVPEPWPTVTVTTDDDPKLAEELANELKDFIWDHRMDFLVKPMPIAKAVETARTAEKGPIVLADIANNPGWGSAADGTALLSEMINQKSENAVIGSLWDRDRKAIEKAIEAGVGSQVTLTVGGKVDDLHGGPLEVTGRVKLIWDGKWLGKGPMGAGVSHDNGYTVVIDINGLLLILTEKRMQITDLQFYRCLGIEPKDKQILAVYSSVHYRAAHDPIAERIIEVDTPGLASPRLAGYPWQHLNRPIFPLDPETFDMVEWKSMTDP
jgi:microcystin degradation protein MlrC